MNVTHLSTFDYEGAGLAALRCHRRMLDLGYKSTLYVQQNRYEQTGMITVPRPPGYNEILIRIMNFIKPFVPEKLLTLRRKLVHKHWTFCTRDSRYFFQNNMESVERGINPGLVSMIKATDVLFVHWVAGFVNSYDVRSVQEKTGCRVFYFAWDMAHLTGGCHFSWGCDGYMNDCVDCPALYDDTRDLASAQLKAKSINISSINATCVCDQDHAITKARKSSIPFASYIKFPIVIEDEVFKPSRVSFKTNPADKRYLLGNASPRGIRKGFSSLCQTLLFLDRLLDDKKKVVLLCLDSEPFKDFRFRHVEFEEFTYKTTDEQLAQVYQMADAFICTSVEDYGPTMLYEALLCGLPSVAFDEGVVDEVVESGKTGYVVAKYDVIGMAEKVYEVLYAAGSITLTPSEIHDGIAQRFDKDAWRTQLERLLNADEIKNTERNALA